jgi:uncharacterized protein YndB with AHSA1/START domain
MSPDAQFTHANMVRFHRPLPAAREKVWALLTTPGLLPGWYGEGYIEAHVGGMVDLMGGHIKGVVTQWVPLKKLAYTWNVFMPGQAVSDFPESYLTFTLDDATLTLEHLPVLDRFVKPNAMGWHTFLDMVEAAAHGEAVEPRAAYMKRNTAKSWSRTAPTAVLNVAKDDRNQSADGSSSDCTRKCAEAEATGRERSSCHASAKTLTMRLPCFVTLAAAITSRGPAERR